MARINRENFQDAKNVVEKLLPDINARMKFINFLGDAISYADVIKSNNWNLNLDKSGQFLRFNIGQEFCIQLNSFELLILCDRTTIKPVIEKENIPVIFLGYTKGVGNIRKTEIDKTPDLVFKTKKSIGCIIEHKNIVPYIDFFNQSNKDFIRAAMNTRLMPHMRQAHSKGAVEYVFSLFDTTKELELPNFSEFIKIEEAMLNKAKTLSQKERLEILNKSSRKPKQTTVKQVVFQRNPFVVAEALFRANGYCEKCKKSAPFFRDNDKTPYLEVHHIVTLAEGGDDTIENVIALCPNCHRQAHYGKTTY